MTVFKMGWHSVTGRRMVEVYGDDGKFVASIYPTNDGSNGIHIASFHFDGPPVPATEGDLRLPVPSYVVRFTK